MRVIDTIYSDGENPEAKQRQEVQETLKTVKTARRLVKTTSPDTSVNQETTPDDPTPETSNSYGRRIIKMSENEEKHSDFAENVKSSEYRQTVPKKQFNVTESEFYKYKVYKRRQERMEAKHRNNTQEYSKLVDTRTATTDNPSGHETATDTENPKTSVEYKQTYSAQKITSANRKHAPQTKSENVFKENKFLKSKQSVRYTESPSPSVASRKEIKPTNSNNTSATKPQRRLVDKSTATTTAATTKNEKAAQVAENESKAAEAAKRANVYTAIVRRTAQETRKGWNSITDNSKKVFLDEDVSTGATYKSMKSGNMLKFVAMLVLLLLLIIPIFPVLIMMFAADMSLQGTYTASQVKYIYQEAWDNELYDTMCNLTDMPLGDTLPIVVGNQAIDWREVFSVYYAYIWDQGADAQTDLVMFTDQDADSLDISSSGSSYLYDVFWTMNDILTDVSALTERATSEDSLYIELNDKNGNPSYTGYEVEYACLVICYHPNLDVVYKKLNMSNDAINLCKTYLSSEYDEVFDEIINTPQYGEGADVVAYAETKMGQKSDEFNRWYNNGYFSYFPWCCLFANYCMYQCGYSSIIPKKGEGAFTTCEYLKDWYKSNSNPGTYVHIKGESNISVVPQAGWLILFTKKADSSYTRCTHVGIVKSYDPKTNKVTYISGNSYRGTSPGYGKNYVCEGSITMDGTTRLEGFCIPAYPVKESKTKREQAIEDGNFPCNYDEMVKTVDKSMLVNTYTPLGKMMQTAIEIRNELEKGLDPKCLNNNVVSDWHYLRYPLSSQSEPSSKTLAERIELLNNDPYYYNITYIN